MNKISDGKKLEEDFASGQKETSNMVLQNSEL